MGFCQSKEASTESSVPTVDYSNNHVGEGNFGKAGIDKANFIVRGKESECIMRKPGSIDGQQFLIEECKNCDIFVLDHSAAVNIDACENCNIYIGPCETSVFIRECTNCRFVVACQQFRTRDCNDISCSLYCQTEPIIESSKDVKIGCFCFSYFGLADQFKKANLEVWENRFSEVHNFTPKFADWSMLRQKELEVLPMDKLPEDVTATFDIVPFTTGRAPDSDCSMIWVPFSEESRLMNLVENLQKAGIVVNRTKVFQMEESDCKSVFVNAPEHKKGTLTKLGSGNRGIGISLESTDETAINDIILSTSLEHYFLGNSDATHEYFINLKRVI
eukprot:TRINITY_DN781981_c0_g1_i1.p1 TRINITY_DN781981_c0_g1~~TRINITY_DN781981_c0_g1_i1.p1  ORF type:complete len:332 (-),score=91.35 TRINITY_DN781981_c0_g1_i1:158-1153(-)